MPIVITKSAMVNDAEALLKIKQSLNNSQFLDSWKNGTQPCDEVVRWVGVVCGKGIVTTLRLRSMQLSGDIDTSALAQLQGLRVLNLVNNSFSGPIPEFNKLGALKAIYVSNNNFSGEIPSGFFTKMVSLKKVWFDKNNFTGPIPSSLAQLPRLLELCLDSNNFWGLIPSIGQQSLETLNLSSNNLSGDIPSSLSRVVRNPPPPLEEPPQKSLKIAYALMALSGFLLVSMIVAIYLIVQKRKREESDEMGMGERDFGGNTIGLRISSIGRKEESGQSSGSGVEKSTGRKSPKKGKGFGDLTVLNNINPGFGLSDLMRAGAEVLGNGSVGSSYKAKLSSGLILVVKRLKEMNKMDADEFRAEMTRLGGLKHPNVLAPLACHYQKEEKLVIYEHIPKGSLLYILHGDRGESHANLNWPTRLKIIHGIALGMSYIHTKLAALALPHGNLKSSNVLLSPDNEPLVVDYGLISIIDGNHAASVLMGYQAPEAIESRSISPKCDVYSLGIVILEILTGKFPSQYHKNNKGGTDVVQWVRSAIQERREAELLDPGISANRHCIGEMLKLLHVGANCTESNPNKRLDIREAVRRIEEILVEGRSVDDSRYEISQDG
ncbi:hypothetical protein OSB04_004417 [Centaurea solstitialis]|uniref:Protein kinase domain-containing protein n=1 Tax=Centaurea solstitialis TaxID=347529 RepID=A0AA38U765_9ASTR|nr:hypothetical protein OSB04_004417 [Centaurea solstitialis]